MPITVGAMRSWVPGAIIMSDLYRGATAGLLLAVTGVLAHAVAALVRRRDPAAVTETPSPPADSAVAVPSTPNVVDFDRRDLAGLTTREREVLQALTHGARTSEIAERLDISERTVKAHLANIYQKLGVESRTAAVAVALQRGPS